MFQEDFQRALHIAQYSAAISNILIANTAWDQPNPPIPPDNLTQSSSASSTQEENQPTGVSSDSEDEGHTD